MTERTVRVCGTSNLLPGNSGWEALRPYGDLQFGDYGDWPAALMAPAAGPLVWVLFLEDLVPPEAAAQTGDERLAEMLLPLRRRLVDAAEPTLVAWSAWRPESPIAAARMPGAWQLLVRRFEALLYRWAAEYPALLVLSLDPVFAVDGIAKAFDTRNFYAARCRLSRRGLAQTAGAAAALFGRLAAPPKKLLVLDCDGTLWGNVVGEVGIGGIVLGGDGTGKAFADFQRAAQRLATKGILLALASKNNEAEVWEVFDHHAGMVLSRSDIVGWRINWQDKPRNLTALAAELDLSPDSVVFWDDNPLEREQMRLALPGVTVPEPPAEISDWPSYLDGLDLFAAFGATAEDARRTDQYRSRAAFRAARQEAVDVTGFLRTLDMRPALLPIDAANLARAVQLIAKTNQFNLRTVRHDAAALSALAGVAGEAAFLVRLSDRFGDHGIVGLVLARIDGEIAFLDSFLLSCRVLGRHLEAWMLGRVCERLKARGVQFLYAEFRDSGRNAVARDFLALHGFAPAPETVAGALPDSLRYLGFAPDLGGQAYVARLDCMAVPHLDVFDDDSDEIARSAAAAIP